MNKNLEEVLACLEALEPIVHIAGRKHSSFNFIITIIIIIIYIILLIVHVSNLYLVKYLTCLFIRCNYYFHLSISCTLT